MAERVKVYCRLRPGSERERRDGLACVATDAAATVSLTQHLGVNAPTQRSWDFDGAYDGEAVGQQRVYDDVGAPILDAVMRGYNGTVLAYGQTGSGKTHTLLNTPTDAASSEGCRAEAGLVPRLVAALFVAIRVDVGHVYTVRVSFAQIYNEQIDDLCARARPSPSSTHDDSRRARAMTAARCSHAPPHPCRG